MFLGYDWNSMSAMIALVFFIITLILLILAASFSNTNLWISFVVFGVLTIIIYLSGERDYILNMP